MTNLKNQPRDGVRLLAPMGAGQLPGHGEGDGEAGVAQLLWAQVPCGPLPRRSPAKNVFPQRGLTSPAECCSLQARPASGRCWLQGCAPHTHTHTHKLLFHASSYPPHAFGVVPSRAVQIQLSLWVFPIGWLCSLFPILWGLICALVSSYPSRRCTLYPSVLTDICVLPASPPAVLPLSVRFLGWHRLWIPSVPAWPWQKGSSQSQPSACLPWHPRQDLHVSPWRQQAAQL